MVDAVFFSKALPSPSLHCLLHSAPPKVAIIILSLAKWLHFCACGMQMGVFLSHPGNSLFLNPELTVWL